MTSIDLETARAAGALGGYHNFTIDKLIALRDYVDRTIHYDHYHTTNWQAKIKMDKRKNLLGCLKTNIKNRQSKYSD
jgi:hypothetical protein